MLNTKKIILSVLIAIGFAAIGSAQVLFLGPCSKKVTVQKDFDVGRYLGIWYEYSKYPAVFEIDGKCNVANYTLRADGNVNVVNTLIYKSTGAIDGISGYATVVSNAKLKVVFPGVPNLSDSSNYWILGTDYESYSVVYSCAPIGRLNLQHAVIVWILTRERHVDNHVIKQAESVLKANDLTTDFLIKTDQTGCCIEDLQRSFY